MRNWEYVKIGDVCELVKGTSEIMKTPIGEHPLVVLAEKRKWSLDYQFDTEAVCIPLVSSTGHGNAAMHRVHYQNGKFALSNLFVAAVPRSGTECSAYFLYWLFTSKKDEYFVPLMQGTSNVSLKIKDVANVVFPLPPLAEQRRIVARLDALKSKIDEVKRLRQEQEKLKQSVRYSFMLNCERNYDFVSIEEICNLKKGSFPIMKTKPGQYPLVVTGEERKTANNYDFDCEAVCVPLVSSTGHGNAALHRVHYEKGKFALSNILCAVMPKNPNAVAAKYLYELFMAMKDIYFVPLMQGSANVSLSMDKIASVPIPLPPIEEQQRIITILNKLHQATQLQTAQLAELEALLPSVLDKAFKGEF